MHTSIKPIISYTMTLSCEASESHMRAHASMMAAKDGLMEEEKVLRRRRRVVELPLEYGLREQGQQMEVSQMLLVGSKKVWHLQNARRPSWISTWLLQDSELYSTLFHYVCCWEKQSIGCIDIEYLNKQYYKYCE